MINKINATILSVLGAFLCFCCQRNPNREIKIGCQNGDTVIFKSANDLKKYSYVKYYDNKVVAEQFDYVEGNIVKMLSNYYSGNTRAKGFNMHLDTLYEGNITKVYWVGMIDYYYEDGKLEEAVRVEGDSCVAVRYETNGKIDFKWVRKIRWNNPASVDMRR